MVGLIDGLIVSKLKVNPFIATLGVGLVLKGILNASFETFVGAVPRSFQTLGYEPSVQSLSPLLFYWPLPWYLRLC